MRLEFLRDFLAVYLFMAAVFTWLDHKNERHTSLIRLFLLNIAVGFFALILVVVFLTPAILALILFASA